MEKTALLGYTNFSTLIAVSSDELRKGTSPVITRREVYGTKPEKVKVKRHQMYLMGLTLQ